MRIANAVVRKPENITFNEKNGEGIIFDTISNKKHVLNRTALAVWNLCDIEEDPQGIARAIASRYGIPSKQVLSDVLECLNRFEEMGLIRRAA
ncbi:MAG: PqqD family protein [Armatimonadota bacterium]